MFRVKFPILSFKEELADVCRALRDTQKNVASYWGSLYNDVEFIGGKRFEVVFASATTNKFAHGLGRTPRGWFLVDQQNNAVIHRDAWDDSTITLSSSAASTCSVWVY